MHIFEKKKGFAMKKRLIPAGAALLAATAAQAHPGAHVHPHDGANWLVMAGALAVLAIAAGLAVAKAKSRK